MSEASCQVQPCDSYEENRREGELERKGQDWEGGHYKGWSDAVSVIKPASTNTGQVFCTGRAHLACLNKLSTPG